MGILHIPLYSGFSRVSDKRHAVVVYLQHFKEESDHDCVFWPYTFHQGTQQTSLNISQFLPIHIQVDQLYMAMCFWYFIKSYWTSKFKCQKHTDIFFLVRMYFIDIFLAHLSVIQTELIYLFISFLFSSLGKPQKKVLFLVVWPLRRGKAGPLRNFFLMFFF